MRRLLPILLFLLSSPLYAAQSTIASLNAALTVNTEGRGSIGIQLSGSCSAGVVTFEGTVDGDNWTALNVFPLASATAVTTSATTGVWTANVGGLRSARARISDACDSDNFTATIVITEAAAGASGGGGGGSGTQYAEDSAHVSGDLLNMAGVVQQSSDTALAGNGDRTALQVDASGYLKTVIKSGAGFDCNGTAIYSTNTNGNTELVAISGSTVIYVCGFSFASSSSTANTVRLVKGTGTACATNEASVTPSYVLQAAASTGPTGIVVMAGGHTGLKTAAGDALCIETNAAQQLQAIVWYAQF